RDNARSMRSVVRAAYSGRCVGSRDSGVIRSSAIGCSRLRLASAKKIRMPRTSRTARTSQRLSARVHCWTEMGGTSRPLQPIRKDLVIRFRRQRLAKEAIMAAKEISVKKYVVRLSGEERERLETLLRKGKSPARRVLKARILLKADVSEAGKGWS